MFKFMIFNTIFTFIFKVLRFIILLPFIVAEWLAKQLSFVQPVPLQLGLQVLVIGLAEKIILYPAYETRLYPFMMIATIGYGLFRGANLEGENTLKLGFRVSKTGTHGSQRWVKEKDLKKANLINPKPALVLGKIKKQFIGPADGAEWHSIMLGGSGTGKTTAGIIPTILNFPGSVVVLDIKGDIYEATHQQRGQLGNIIRISATDEDTWRFDPLKQCDPTPEGRTECMELARALIPDPPTGGGNEQWIVDGTRGLVAAMAFYAGSLEQNLSWLASQITSRGKEVSNTILTSNNRVMLSYAQSFLSNLEDKTAGYYISKANEYLISYALDENIQRITTPEENVTFDFDMLESPCTVYLQVPEAKLAQFSDLWRLIFMQLLRHLQQRGEGAQPHVLVAIDEFPQLGKMDKLPEMFATLRSRNVHVLLAGQSIADIDAKYDQVTRRRIIDNCNYVSIFNATDPEGQKYFSDLLGKQTIIVNSGGTSDSNQKTSIVGGSKGKSTSWQETGRELVRPEELRDLGDEVIVVPRQTFPMRLQKAYWFKEITPDN